MRVGLSFCEDDCRIAKINSASPADLAGLLVGDKIVSINRLDVRNCSLAAAQELRNSAGSISLCVDRCASPKDRKVEAEDEEEAEDKEEPLTFEACQETSALDLADLQMLDKRLREHSAALTCRQETVALALEKVMSAAVQDTPSLANPHDPQQVVDYSNLLVAHAETQRVLLLQHDKQATEYRQITQRIVDLLEDQRWVSEMRGWLEEAIERFGRHIDQAGDDLLGDLLEDDVPMLYEGDVECMLEIEEHLDSDVAWLGAMATDRLKGAADAVHPPDELAVADVSAGSNASPVSVAKCTRSTTAVCKTPSQRETLIAQRLQRARSSRGSRGDLRGELTSRGELRGELDAERRGSQEELNSGRRLEQKKVVRSLSFERRKHGSCDGQPELNTEQRIENKKIARSMSFERRRKHVASNESTAMPATEKMEVSTSAACASPLRPPRLESVVLGDASKTGMHAGELCHVGVPKSCADATEADDDVSCDDCADEVGVSIHPL